MVDAPVEKLVPTLALRNRQRDPFQISALGGLLRLLRPEDIGEAAQEFLHRLESVDLEASLGVESDDCQHGLLQLGSCFGMGLQTDIGYFSGDGLEAVEEEAIEVRDLGDLQLGQEGGELLKDLDAVSHDGAVLEALFVLEDLLGDFIFLLLHGMSNDSIYQEE